MTWHFAMQLERNHVGASIGELVLDSAGRSTLVSTYKDTALAHPPAVPELERCGTGSFFAIIAF